MQPGDARVIATVTGYVQGVGFRYWARERARALGLRGSATNLMDSRVRVIAEGPREACGQLVAAMRGPGAPGRVEDVSVQWADPVDEPDGFRVR